MTDPIAVGRRWWRDAASGPVLALAEPLSFWGGVDPTTGAIIEPRHPDVGRSVAGQVLAMPAVRGSSSSSSILAELLRLGVGPAAILLGERDEILVVGALAAAELYGVDLPGRAAGPGGLCDRRGLRHGRRSRCDGTITGT